MKKEHPNTSTPSSNTDTIRSKAIEWWTKQVRNGNAKSLRDKYFNGMMLIDNSQMEEAYVREHPQETIKEGNNIDWDLYPGNEAGSFDHLDEQLNDKFDELLDRENEAIKEQRNNREEEFTLLGIIKDLRAENKRLKEALLKIDAIAYRNYGWQVADDISDIVKEALKQVTK